MKELRNCQKCGAEMMVYPSASRKFCSNDCYRSATTNEAIAAGIGKPQKPRRGHEIPCGHCGKPVYVTKSLLAANKKFCSRECGTLAQTKDPIVKECAQCAKEIRLQPSQSERQYCSKKCESVHKIKRPLNRLHNGKQAKQDIAGYVMVWEPNHPNQTQKGWQYEHRLVVESTLGRYLVSNEHVHHVNGVKDDNRPENLVMMDDLEHLALSGTEFREQMALIKSEWEEYRRLYGPLPKK